MRQCTECKLVKPESEFDQRANRKVGYCKDCRRKKIKEHYNKNVQYYIKKSKKNNKSYKERFMDFKRTLSCTDCEMSFKDEPYMCEFHHLDPSTKDYNLSNLKESSMKKIMEEVDKCVPLCPNCHRRRHNAPLAKPDTAPEYESGDFESSNLSRGTEYKGLPIESIKQAIERQNQYWT